MISDAGLRMLPETLLDMVSYLNDKTVLVHQLPFVCLRQGFAGILEMAYFGCAQARMYLVSDLFGFICLTGMSFIIKKEILEDAGGLGAYAKYIAEDYFIAQTVHRKNLHFSISSLPALQNSGVCNVRAYQERMIRWTRLRVHMLPQLLILEPCNESVLLGKPKCKKQPICPFMIR
jgi:ceramide glucosyltransferase